MVSLEGYEVDLKVLEDKYLKERECSEKKSTRLSKNSLNIFENSGALSQKGRTGLNMLSLSTLVTTKA